MRVSRWIQTLSLTVVAAASDYPTALEGATVYQATGSREDVQPTVDRFKRDIVYGVGSNPNSLGDAIAGFRVATFDDLVQQSTTTQGFAAGDSHDILFQGPGQGPLPFFGGALISANSNDSDNPNRLFGDIHPDYPTQFQPFSSPAILAQQGFELSFALRDCCDTFPLTAFGAMFLDVDSPTSSTIVFDTANFGRSEYAVPAASGNGQFSFLGVILAPAEMGMNLVTFNLPLLRAEGEDALHDMVAVDDVILGAVGVPEPSSWVLGMIGAGLFIAWRWLRKPQSTCSKRLLSSLTELENVTAGRKTAQPTALSMSLIWGEHRAG